MDYNSTMQTVSWFHDRYRDGSLTISPRYQRKPVWVARQKCYLIESVLLGLPVPEVFVQHKTTAEGKTTYAIVDGQQRVRTVLQFIGSDKDPSEQEYNKFKLDKLEPGSPWHGLGFVDLSEDDKKAFFGYRFVVRDLDTDNDDQVRDMFTRLNRFLSPLKPQELRNATYGGPFVRLALDLANNEYWAENRIVTPSSIRRMGDVEFVSELLIGVMHGPQGGSPAVIDDYYKQYEDYEEEFPSQRQSARLFEKTLGIVQSVLPDIKQTRWGNKTDFYTLFVASAHLLRVSELPSSKISQFRKSLLAFAEKVGQTFAGEAIEVEDEVAQYVGAVEKGVNDKARRATRHTIVLRLIGPLFKAKKSKG